MKDSVKQIPENINEAHFYQFQEESGIIGQSQAVRQIYQTIDQVAPSDITVLIIGESGTGKELVAKSIHDRSSRADKPLIIVNCGAIPEGIIESELFGHEKGAFTGAVGVRKGYFESANEGTVFLDEIGEMPLSAQVKLLRVLEGNEYSRVGSTETKKADVRIIAATNRELNKEVQNGAFRQDLYFRLRSVTIQLATLRNRREDIALLAQNFANKFCKENKIDFKGFDETAFTVMQKYNWPGNIRELKNIIESIIILEKGSKINHQIMMKYLDTVDEQAIRNLPIPVNKAPEQVEREFIYRALLDMKTEIAQLREIILTRLFPPKRLNSWEADHSIFPTPGSEEIVYDESAIESKPLASLEDMERKLIEDTLKRFDGNKRKTSKNLKISERTLYRKIKEYNLQI